MKKKAKGTLDDFSTDQLNMVKELQKLLAEDFKQFPELNTTWHILRFLRARDFNFSKTKAMLEATFTFRRKKDYKRMMQIDMLSEKIKALRQDYTSAHYGTDKQGRILIIEKVANYNHQLLNRFTPEDIEDYLIQRYERMIYIEYPLSSMAHNSRIDHTFLLVDLKGVDVIKIFNSHLKAFIKIGIYVTQNNYPELLAISFFVNSPLIFKAIWAIIAIWLDKRTREKFYFEKNQGLVKLANFLDIDQLPVEMGGKNTVPISEGFGLWTKELQRSYVENSYFLFDRQPEYNFYLTNEEKITKETVEKSLLKDKKFNKSLFETKDNNEYKIEEIKVSKFRVSLLGSSREENPF